MKPRLRLNHLGDLFFFELLLRPSHFKCWANQSKELPRCPNHVILAMNRQESHYESEISGENLLSPRSPPLGAKQLPTQHHPTAALWPFPGWSSLCRWPGLNMDCLWRVPTPKVPGHQICTSPGTTSSTFPCCPQGKYQTPLGPPENSDHFNLPRQQSTLLVSPSQPPLGIRRSYQENSTLSEANPP